MCNGATRRHHSHDDLVVRKEEVGRVSGWLLYPDLRHEFVFVLFACSASRLRVFPVCCFASCLSSSSRTRQICFAMLTRSMTSLSERMTKLPSEIRRMIWRLVIQSEEDSHDDHDTLGHYVALHMYSPTMAYLYTKHLAVAEEYMMARLRRRHMIIGSVDVTATNISRNSC